MLSCDRVKGNVKWEYFVASATINPKTYHHPQFLLTTGRMSHVNISQTNTYRQTDRHKIDTGT